MPSALWSPPVAAAGRWLALQAALVELQPAVPPCATDAELWWSLRPDDQAAAVDGCMGCRVLWSCRGYVVAAGRAERDGVWGGLTPGERAGLRAAS